LIFEFLELRGRWSESFNMKMSQGAGLLVESGYGMEVFVW